MHSDIVYLAILAIACLPAGFFKPAPGLCYDTLSDNGQAIYDSLNAKREERHAQ